MTVYDGMIQLMSSGGDHGSIAWVYTRGRVEITCSWWYKRNTWSQGHLYSSSTPCAISYSIHHDQPSCTFSTLLLLSMLSSCMLWLLWMTAMSMVSYRY